MVTHANIYDMNLGARVLYSYYTLK